MYNLKNIILVVVLILTLYSYECNAIRPLATLRNAGVLKIHDVHDGKEVSSHPQIVNVAPHTQPKPHYAKFSDSLEEGIACDVCEWVVREIQHLLGDNENVIISVAGSQCGLIQHPTAANACQAIVTKFGPEFLQAIEDRLNPRQVCQRFRLCCPDDSSSSEEPSTSSTTGSSTTESSTTESSTTESSTSTTTGTSSTTESSTSTTTGTSTTASTTTGPSISSGSISSSTTTFTSGGHTSATGGLMESNELVGHFNV